MFIYATIFPLSPNRLLQTFFHWWPHQGTTIYMSIFFCFLYFQKNFFSQPYSWLSLSQLNVNIIIYFFWTEVFSIIQLFYKLSIILILFLKLTVQVIVKLFISDNHFIYISLHENFSIFLKLFRLTFKTLNVFLVSLFTILCLSYINPITCNLIFWIESFTLEARLNFSFFITNLKRFLVGFYNFRV
jgi:hypothetical protein